MMLSDFHAQLIIGAVSFIFATGASFGIMRLNVKGLWRQSSKMKSDFEKHLEVAAANREGLLKELALIQTRIAVDGESQKSLTEQMKKLETAIEKLTDRMEKNADRDRRA